MNNMYPFFPQPIQNPNLYEEIRKLKEVNLSSLRLLQLMKRLHQIISL